MPYLSYLNLFVKTDCTNVHVHMKGNLVERSSQCFKIRRWICAKANVRITFSLGLIVFWVGSVLRRGGSSAAGGSTDAFVRLTFRLVILALAPDRFHRCTRMDDK